MEPNTAIWNKIRTIAVTGMDESVERDNHLINSFPDDAGNFTTKTILRSYPQFSFSAFYRVLGMVGSRAQNGGYQRTGTQMDTYSITPTFEK